MSVARTARPQPLADTGGPRRETGDSARVIGVPAAEVALETAGRRVAAPKIIPTASDDRSEDEASPETSSGSEHAATAGKSPTPRRQVDEQLNNVVAILVDSNQQQQANVRGNSVGTQRPRRAPARRKRTGISFNPSDSLCYWWSAAVSLAFLYNFWSLSYRFAFREIDASTWLVWFALDYAADSVYFLDIVVMIKTGYLEDGVLQRDANKIKAHYLDSTLFYLDSACLLPFDILYLSFGYNSIFRCNRLIKIYKFWSFVDRTERHTNYPNVFRTFTLVHYILVIFHWNACLFNMISDSHMIDVKTLFKINDNKCEDISCKYLHAFYWSTLALTIIGGLPRPRVQREYIFVIVELFFGLFLFAYVLGHVANIVTNVSAARKEFQARLDAVKTFMRTRRVSDDLQRKVIRWFDYLWISQKSSDEERSVACLPDRLKAEIAIHVNLDTLKRVDIFQATEAGFLRELVLRLKPVLFSPGDYVCRKDEAGHEMYIVSRGILEVVTDEGQTVVATFRAGSYFGEIAVLNVGAAGNKRTASVRSVGYSDLFCLSKQDLWDVLKDYPNAEARIRAVAEERLSALGGRWGGPAESSSRGRGRPSLRRAAPATSGRQANYQLRGAADDDNMRSADSLDACDVDPEPGGGLDPPPVDQRRRVCSSGSSTHHRAARRATEAGPSRGRAPNSLTMEPICDHAYALPETRPLRQAASGHCLTAAGGGCCECQQHIRRNHCSERVASTRCLCQHCHPSSAPVRLAAAAAAAPDEPSPYSDATNRASLGTQRFSMSCSSGSTTTCAINQHAAGNSCAGATRNGRLQTGGESLAGHNRHQLSVASCHNHHHEWPAPLPIGQSHSFECTPTGAVRDGCPATAHRLSDAPDSGRSDRALATRPHEAPFSPSDATTTTASSTPEHTNQTSTMIERRHPALRLGCVPGSDTTSVDSSAARRPAAVDASLGPCTSLLQPDASDHAGDLRRTNSLREPHHVRSPVAHTAAHSNFDLEGQSEVHQFEVDPGAWQDRLHHHHHYHHHHPRSGRSMQFEDAVTPTARQQLHRATCRKRSRQTPAQQVVIPGSPAEGPRTGSRGNQPAPTNQRASSSSAFQAINPPAELHLAIDVEDPRQEPGGGNSGGQ